MTATTSKPTTFDAIAFRRHLHQYPELSENEFNTATLIATQLNAFGLSPITGVGGHGVICIIEGQKSGPTTLFRADFDALPIEEKATHHHISRHPGVMHACGHDGHSTSLLKVAEALATTPPRNGRVILLFQPAEEVGTGAIAMLEHPALKNLTIDHTFAYHNLPGYPLHHVIIKPQTFACASTGVQIELVGKTSHAANPENGINPTDVMIELVQFLRTLPARYPDAFSLVTVAHVQLGEHVFGVAPGDAKILATLRSDHNPTFTNMKLTIQDKIEQIQRSSHLQVKLNWHEPFIAAVNDTEHYHIVKQQANELGLTVSELKEPMRWSEDFAEFLKRWPGALFCIGSGEDHPQLHNPDYDFPDALIDTASRLFLSIIDSLHHH
ncbi:amidohydrolase [Vibrio olivae]|uniref:Amidohydrolase n=1 Tax=Vibrio olivae TaxID=1243002 RepID=A0ABV5HK52_9VIBR